LVTAVASSGGCAKNDEMKEKKEDALKPKADTMAKAPTPERIKGPEALSAEELDKIPTEEDFEDEADEQITQANLEAEVDKLAKEIDQ